VEDLYDELIEQLDSSLRWNDKVWGIQARMMSMNPVRIHTSCLYELWVKISANSQGEMGFTSKKESLVPFCKIAQG